MFTSHKTNISYYEHCNSHNTLWGYSITGTDGEAVEQWTDVSNISLIHDAKLDTTTSTPPRLVNANLVAYQPLVKESENMPTKPPILTTIEQSESHLFIHSPRKNTVKE